MFKFQYLIIAFIVFLSPTLIFAYFISDVETIDRRLSEGSRGEDVRLVQEVLSRYPDLYPEKLITGFYGPLTKKAVERFQSLNNLEKVGVVGPKTRAGLNKLASDLRKTFGGEKVLGINFRQSEAKAMNEIARDDTTATSFTEGKDTSIDKEGVGVIIRFSEKPNNNEKQAIERAGGKIKHAYDLVPAVAARVPTQALIGIMNNPNIRSVELDVNITASSLEFDNTWGVRHIGAEAVQSIGNKGAGIKVAVLDTGIDYNHSELSNYYAGGYDFVNNDNDPYDDNGHGTHVAGTIMAAADDVGVIGVGPEVEIYSLKVMTEDGRGSFSDVIAALDWAVDNGIQVTNHSYGATFLPGSTVKEAFDKAELAGIVSVAAAGNSGTCSGDKDSVNYPAGFDSVVAVSAINSSDNRPCFSSTGPKVELSAPGVSVNSTILGGGHASYSGTSMASPHVAGVSALLFATAGLSDQNNNGRMNDEVRQALLMTAKDLGVTGRDTHYGYGLIQADKAVDLYASSTEPLPEEPKEGEEEIGDPEDKNKENKDENKKDGDNGSGDDNKTTPTLPEQAKGKAKGLNR